MTHRGTVFTTEYTAGPEDVRSLLEAADLKNRLNRCSTILIKPNLVEALAPPITTPVELVKELILALREANDCRIVVGEGCGAMDYSTWHVFDELGYNDMARELQVELLDLNDLDLVRLANPSCNRWPEMPLPRIALESFLISVPVLKAHTLAGVTLTMKNMMGLVPPAQFCNGSWKKSAFHDRVQEGIADLNRYRTPDFTLLDASVGMAEAHLWGPTCDPPVNKLAAGYDPVAIDAYGASLLGRDWQRIGHIKALHGELGRAEPLQILQVNSGAA